MLLPDFGEGVGPVPLGLIAGWYQHEAAPPDAPYLPLHDPELGGIHQVIGGVDGQQRGLDLSLESYPFRPD